MSYSFQIGQRYTRRDVYRIIGISEDTHGGNWATGYARYDNSWFIFCNIGTSGRTGHDYANQWVGNRLEWYGRTTSQLHHPSIQSMLSVDSDTYILWREDNKEPFIFAGIGNAEELEDITPVKIIWTFETEIFPDEISPSTTFREGTVCKVSVNAYERNPVVRQKCIEHYGATCYVCCFNFGKVFGELGDGFIHIHHLRPLSEIGEEYEVNPVEDLRPVCPNCHAMIHRRSPPLTIEEIKALLLKSAANYSAT
ncbi:DUF3427 domain-containing protein [Microcoleus sp. herbarium14]|uniref:DUF3427 domain-containing protein n=1 Tax=Microcoleus sp. herbarium14 TaxID=3055439 RepID=UPI002FD4DEE3